MMRLGFVSIDTSHPESWLPIEREFGCEVIGFFDEGEIHPASHARDFGERHGLKVFSSLDDLVGSVDAVIIHSCNWDRHVSQAEPFIRAGKAVFIDKPMAGSLRDIEQLLAWSRDGARLAGGSCFFLCEEIEHWKANRGQHRPHTLFAGCAVDEFNYAIHAYSMAAAVFGPGIRRVRFLGSHVQDRIQLEWTGGESAFLSIGAQDGWLQGHLTIVTDRSAIQLRPGTDHLYDGYVRSVLGYLAGLQDHPPVAMQALLECELAAIGALESRLHEGKWIELRDLDDRSPSYDGADFASSYKRQKYPGVAS